MENEEWRIRMENEEREMGKREWGVENGEWRMRNGE